jgi:hypothetical protein
LQTERASVHHVANNPAYPGTEEKQQGSGAAPAMPGNVELPKPSDSLSDPVFPPTLREKLDQLKRSDNLK